MKFSKYFELQEFASHDGAPFTPLVKKNLKELAQNLDVLRDYIGKPIHINSGYRSPAQNAACDGASQSKHMLGQAADIHVLGMTPNQVKNSIEYLISIGKMKQGGLGFYSTWIHYDVRGTKARWNG